MKMILAIALGGALGAVGRYAFTARVNAWTDSAFGATVPTGVLAANIVGSFLMGVLVELFANVWTTSPEARAFLTVGILGAFTTFSTFSFETVMLLQKGEALKAVVYVAASVFLSVLGLFAGMTLAKGVFA